MAIVKGKRKDRIYDLSPFTSHRSLISLDFLKFNIILRIGFRAVVPGLLAGVRLGEAGICLLLVTDVFVELFHLSAHLAAYAHHWYYEVENEPEQQVKNYRPEDEL